MEELEVCMQLQGCDVMGSQRGGRIAQVTGTLWWMDVGSLGQAGKMRRAVCPICERVAGIHVVC